MSDPKIPKLGGDDRPRTTFTIPDSERQFPTDPKTLTVVPLRTSEELEVGKLANLSKGDPAIAYMNEAVRRAVVEIDGRPVDWASPTGPEWLERASPKVRVLAKRAFNHVNSPDDDAAEAFLASATIVSAS